MKPLNTLARATIAALLASAAAIAYGWSAAPFLGEDSAWRLWVSGAAGWILSLAILIPLSQKRPRAILDHGSFILTAAVLPLIPLIFINAVAPSDALNAGVLLADGLLVLTLMAIRLKQAWVAMVWFAVREGSGMATWVLL